VIAKKGKFLFFVLIAERNFLLTLILRELQIIAPENVIGMLLAGNINEYVRFAAKNFRLRNILLRKALENFVVKSVNFWLIRISRSGKNAKDAARSF